MPSYSKEKQQYHRERVRAVLVVRPNATPHEIQRVLNESADASLHLDHDYITKIMKKIVDERRTRLERSHINLRLAVIQDKKQAIDERLWSEATNPENPAVARVVALKELLKNELELLQAEMDAGVFTRHLGELQHQAAPLTAERKAELLAVFIRWGFVKPKPTQDNGSQAQTKSLINGTANAS